MAAVMDLGRIECAGRCSTLPHKQAFCRWFDTVILAALTGSASGGLTIALDALGGTYLRLANEHGIDPALLHRVAVMSAGALDSLPHNGAVVTLLAVCGTTHRDSYFDIVIVGIIGALIALAAVILLGSVLGSF